MRADIISYLEKEVLRRSESEMNKFGVGVYGHICLVVNNVANMSDKYGANLEIVLISAWLHDIASITNYSLYNDHHIHSARIADDILSGFNYDLDKIEKVKQCILHHRGSVLLEKASSEEQCVADADAISHFDNIPSLLYLAYVTRKLDIEEGVKFVEDKLNRSWNKLSKKGKSLYQKKYDETISVLTRHQLVDMIHFNESTLP